MGDCYDDIVIGETRQFGNYEVTAEEIIDFAERYDPQPFHTNPEAAEQSRFDGLVASGFHTAAMTQRMLVDNYYLKSGVVGIGADNLRLPEPVRPGDTLHIELETIEKKPMRSDADLIRSDSRTITDDGIEVLTMEPLLLFKHNENDEEST